jgi:hypothetical protein
VDAIRASASPPWVLLGRANGASGPVSLYAVPDGASQPAEPAKWLAIAAPQHLSGEVQIASAAPPAR